MTNIMNYKNKKVLILGLGLNEGGLGAARFFSKNGAIVRVTDLKNKETLKPSLDQLIEFPNVTYTLGEHKEEDIDWADLIIKNPALKDNNPYLLYALKQGKEVEMDMGIFLQFVNPKQIIGVTGSKGKSTTASLLYKIMIQIKRKGVKLNHPEGGNVVFAGNIGKSVLDTIPSVSKDTLVILEISSFQLQAFEQHKVSPHISVITNIFPEHLNYYPKFEDYISTKRVIAKYQKDEDLLFLNKNDQVTNSKKFLDDLKAQIDYFTYEDLPSNFASPIQGVHNHENIAAAIKVAEALGIKKDDSLNAIKNFKGIEFRMQETKNWEGVKIINDTAATNPDAAISALKTYPNCILIAGGMNKGLDYKEFAKAIEKYPKAVYFLEGEATEAIQSSNFKVQSSKMKGIFNNLPDLLKEVKKEVKSGDVILFSPGATSFNLFQNEFDRGRKFNLAVEEVFKE